MKKIAQKAQHTLFFIIFVNSNNLSMTRNNPFFILIVTALSIVTLFSCKGQNDEDLTSTAVDTTTETSSVESAETTGCDSVSIPEEMILEEIQWHLDHGNIQEAEQWRSMLSNPPEMKPKVENKEKPAKPQPKQVSTSGQKSLYISTYGANGKVWGHVRMNGNTGHGTIHDDDENSYSITVTRHGNELFGTDQNGRQYVFKL